MTTVNDPRQTARLAGAFWLVVLICGVISVVTQSQYPRLAFAVNEFAGVCYLGVTVLLYQLFKPVNASLATFAACCGLAGVAAGSGLSGGRTDPPTLGFTIPMVFFGVQIITVGWLITRSTLIPRVLGVLLALGGSSYVINSFTNFLSPELGAHVMPFIVPIAILGEGSLTLWLLLKGAKPPEARLG